LPEEQLQDYIDVRKLIEVNFLEESYALHDIFLKAVASVRKMIEREKSRD
jgi:hypothetical protein